MVGARKTSNPNGPMVKPTQDWQGEHASYPLGVRRIGVSFFSASRCLADSRALAAKQRNKNNSRDL
jgi:hypothetical protein